MKRQYNKPSMVVVDFEVQSILCMSVGMSSTSQENSSALSRRRGSSFDDEDDY